MVRFRLELHTRKAPARSVRYWWILRGANGKTLAHSEIYKTKRAAMSTAGSLALALRIQVDDRTKVSAGNL